MLATSCVTSLLPAQPAASGVVFLAAPIVAGAYSSVNLVLPGRAELVTSIARQGNRTAVSRVAWTGLTGSVSVVGVAPGTRGPWTLPRLHSGLAPLCGHT